MSYSTQHKSAPFGVLLAASILAACQITSTQAGEVKLSAAEVCFIFSDQLALFIQGNAIP